MSVRLKDGREFARTIDTVYGNPAKPMTRDAHLAKFRRNFGAALAIWDWMFGTLHLSERQELEFGLGVKEGSEGDLHLLYLQPLVDMARIARRIVLRPFRRLRSQN